MYLNSLTLLACDLQVRFPSASSVIWLVILDHFGFQSVIVFDFQGFRVEAQNSYIMKPV